MADKYDSFLEGDQKYEAFLESPTGTPVSQPRAQVNVKPLSTMDKLLAKFPSLSPDVESDLRKTLQGAASGPVMGAVQLGAGLIGRKDIEEQIAKTSKEGNLLGSLLQPEAWLTGGAMGAAASLPKRMATAAGLGAGYGGLTATQDTKNPLEARGETALISGMLGGAIPAVTTSFSKLGGGIENLKNTLSAALGNEKAVQSLAADAARNLAKADSAFINNALQNRTQYVPGATPTVAEAIAEQNIGKPFQSGGATIRMQKTLTGAVGAEDVLPSAMRSQMAALESYRSGVEKALAPVRNSILRRANKTGIDTTPVLQTIQTVMTTPGEREARLVESVMPKLFEKINGLKQYSPNVVDARDLYSIRKNLNQDIKSWAKESGTWDKKLGSKIARDVQLQIDAAIDNAVGNNMWSRGYMKPYSDRMSAVRAHETRLEEAKEISKAVKSSAKATLTTGEVPQLPNVLSRPISVINYGLKKILGDANTPVAKELARRMADPDEYAKLLALPESNPYRQLAAKAIAVSAGQAVDQE